jgi:hypothetical protein
MNRRGFFGTILGGLAAIAGLGAVKAAAPRCRTRLDAKLVTVEFDEWNFRWPDGVPDSAVYRFGSAGPLLQTPKRYLTGEERRRARETARQLAAWAKTPSYSSF